MTVENINIKVATDANKAATKINSLAESLAKLRDTANSVRIKGFSKIGEGLSSATRQVGNTAKNAMRNILSFGDSAKTAAKGLGTMFNALKRIAIYRLLRTIIKEITQAFSEGLKNAYTFSKGIEGTLAKALDTVSMKSMTMKNQLGAAFGNLLQILQPILLQIIQLITRLASALSMLMSVFGGGQYLVATDVAKSWDEATGSAKKYRNTLLGFDEINRLNDETGGGSASSTYQEGMFKLGTIPEELQNFADTVKSLASHENWETLGAFIAEKINQAISSIDLTNSARVLGEKIGGIISTAYGFVGRIDTRSLAHKLSSAINTVVNEINFTHLGAVLASRVSLIGNFVLGMIESVDWNGIGSAIGGFFRGMFDHIKEWLDSVNWGKAGLDLFNAIKDFITGIDFVSLASSFWGLFKSALNAAIKGATGFLKGVNEWIEKQDWGEIGTKFHDLLKGALEGIDFAELAESIFSLLGSALAGGIQFIATFIEGVVSDIKDYFSNYIEEARTKFEDEGTAIGQGILNGIGSAFKSMFNWIGEHIFAPFVEAFEDVFLIHSPSKVMADKGEFIGEGILEGILRPFQAIYDWIKTNIADPILNNIKTAFGIEGTESSSMLDIGKALGNGIKNGFKERWDNFVTSLQGWWKNLKDWWSGLSLGNITGGVSINTEGMSHGTPGKFADGGYPQVGSLFIAGEAGAELVTNMGGRTGVVNAEQMGAAVASGNANVVGAVYAMADAIVTAINNKDTDIQMDGESVARMLYRPMQQETKRRGSSLVTGGVYG